MREPGRYDALREAEQDAVAQRHAAAELDFREVGAAITDRAAPPEHQPTEKQEAHEPEPEPAPEPEFKTGYEAALEFEAQLLERIQEKSTDGKSNGGDVKDFMRREIEKFDREQERLDRLMGGMTQEAGQEHEQGMESGHDTRER